MADVQAMKQTIIQEAIEFANAAVQAMAVDGAEAAARPRSQAVNTEPKTGRSILKEPYKYVELRNFQLEINNFFQTFGTSSASRVPITLD